MRVYTLGPKGVLHAFELDSGKVLWKRDIQGEYKVAPFFFGVGAVPILHGDQIIANLGGTDLGTGFTFAFDKTNGKLVWKTPTGGGAYAAGRIVEIDGVEHLFIFIARGSLVWSLRPGKERWQFRWHSRIYDSVNATTPVIVGDICLISAAYRTGAAALRIKKSSYDVLWQDSASVRKKILASHWSNIHARDGFVYGFSGRHESEASLNCVELKSGKIHWEWPGFLGRGSMLFSDGHYIALGERGQLALLQLDPDGHKVLHRVENVLKFPAWTPPVLANGLLYLRDEEKIICVDLNRSGSREARSSSEGTAEDSNPSSNAQKENSENGNR